MEQSKLNRIIGALSRRQLLNWMPDSMYLKMRFKVKVGYRLNLQNPTTFNEKLQWLKINNHNKAYIKMVDKYSVKKYVAEVIGENYIIPNVGGPWNAFKDIDFDALPEQFVLKCTHDSGGTVICTDKDQFDKKSAESKINKTLKHNYFWEGREWPYKGVKPLIIAEKYVGDPNNIPPTDYKLMCFNGKVKCSFTVTNRFSKGEIYVNFYDREWKPMPFTRHYERNPVEIKCPKTYPEMVRLAERLAEGIPFVRVDFYEIAGKTYFGELTFFPGGGMEEFDPYEWDVKMGSWITLPDLRSKQNGNKKDSDRC